MAHRAKTDRDTFLAAVWPARPLASPPWQRARRKDRDGGRCQTCRADVYFIVLTHPEVTTVGAADEDEAHKKRWRSRRQTHAVDAATHYYPFPIGVSTVGRSVTPGKGNEMFIANTTGTSTDRIEGMILKNAIYGIIAAKACGVANPHRGHPERAPSD